MSRFGTEVFVEDVGSSSEVSFDFSLVVVFRLLLGFSFTCIADDARFGAIENLKRGTKTKPEQKIEA